MLWNSPTGRPNALPWLQGRLPLPPCLSCSRAFRAVSALQHVLTLTALTSRIKGVLRHGPKQAGFGYRHFLQNLASLLTEEFFPIPGLTNLCQFALPSAHKRCELYLCLWCFCHLCGHYPYPDFHLLGKFRDISLVILMNTRESISFIWKIKVCHHIFIDHGHISGSSWLVKEKKKLKFTVMSFMCYSGPITQRDSRA